MLSVSIPCVRTDQVVMSVLLCVQWRQANAGGSRDRGLGGLGERVHDGQGEGREGQAEGGGKEEGGTRSALACALLVCLFVCVHVCVVQQNAPR